MSIITNSAIFLIKTRYYPRFVLGFAHMGNYNRDDRSGSRRDSGRRDPGRRGSGRRDFGGRGRDRVMHKAICASCGRECEVPFEPRDGRPVFCSDCFENKNFENKNEGSPAPRRGDFERKHEQRPLNNEQLETIILKLDKILDVLTAASVVEEKEEQTKPKKAKTVDKKKKAKKKA